DHGHIQLTAVADDIVGACATQHSNPGLDGPALTDKVNHGLSSLAICDFFDLRDLASVDQDRVIGAPTARQFERLAGAVNDDNFRWGQRFEALNADVA